VTIREGATVRGKATVRGDVESGTMRHKDTSAHGSGMIRGQTTGSGRAFERGSDTRKGGQPGASPKAGPVHGDDGGTKMRSGGDKQ